MALAAGTEQATPPPGLNRRQRRLWQLHDFGRGRGLEIGPLHNTSVRREHAAVSYLDVFDRDRLLANYAGHANVDPERIPEIDYALFDGEQVRTMVETLDGVEPFDWVMASHVVEHVPDVVGWLAEVAALTVDGGHLVLVVPDRRYCFDVHRPGTSTGQLLQAHDAGDRTPSLRAVYDYKRGHAVTDAARAWTGRVPTYAKRIYDLAQVQEQVALQRAGEYVDSHVWTFTPGSLLEQLVELRDLGLSEWVVSAQRPTRRGENEFFMVLRRLPRAGWDASDLADEPPVPDVPDWLQQWVDVRHDLRSARTRLKGAQQRIEELEQRLADVEGSVRWRAGGALTAPVRGVRRLRRRG